MLECYPDPLHEGTETGAEQSDSLLFRVRSSRLRCIPSTLQMVRLAGVLQLLGHVGVAFRAGESICTGTIAGLD